MRLHWHRQDLRVADNPALTDGTAPVLGLFVFDPALIEKAGPPRVAFLREAIQALRSQYRERAGELLVRYGDSRQVVPEVATDLGVDTVSWEADYSALADRRDTTVTEGLSERDIETAVTHGAVLHPPGAITTNAGDPYQVFTYFGRKWADRDKQRPRRPPASADLISGSVEPGDIPTLEAFDMSSPTACIPDAGPEPARDRLSAFCQDKIFHYEDRRDDPAADATSRLSQDLSFGTIGIRHVWAATEQAHADADTASGRESVREYQRQLAWREFYTQVLADNPAMPDRNLTQFVEPIAWRSDPEGLAAWKAGETGFPIVDAGMRQLQEEAFMHNRLRMIVASFLTKDLLIDWREGYAWFRERLVDHDTANDAGGWQWAASTGTDAQPFFRIFNPMTQGERYDPEATYIKRYVPALADVPAEVIHRWPDLTAEERDRHAPSYPAPIVDHGERREAALAMYREARGESAE